MLLTAFKAFAVVVLLPIVILIAAFLAMLVTFALGNLAGLAVRRIGGPRGS